MSNNHTKKVSPQTKSKFKSFWIRIAIRLFFAKPVDSWRCPNCSNKKYNPESDVLLVSRAVMNWDLLSVRLFKRDLDAGYTWHEGRRCKDCRGWYRIVNGC